MTALVKLVASRKDGLDYIIYVFECLEEYMIKQSKYIMCTRYPNWDAPTIGIGDIGYVEFQEIRAGIDHWWNGEKMVPYEYNTIQFLKFIDKPENVDNKYVM